MRTGDVWRRLWGTATRRPTNFGWVIAGRLAGSGCPTTRAEVDWLRRQGIRAVVTLTEAPLSLEWLGPNVQYAHLPVTNHTGPTLETLHKAVDFLEASLLRGDPVLVHCAAGHGRTGTVLASYLVKSQGLGADEAIRAIRQLRPGSVENRDQEEAVRNFARGLPSGG